MTRFLLAAGFLAAVGLAGCDAVSDARPAVTADARPYCDPDDFENPCTGGGGGGTPSPPDYVYSCPADFETTSAYVLEDDPDNQSYVEVKRTLDVFDDDGRKYHGRVVISNNHYLSGIGFTPAANAMTQLQVKCSRNGDYEWRVPAESQFSDYDTKATVKGWSRTITGGIATASPRQCYSANDADRSSSNHYDEVHSKANIFRFDDSGLWKSTHAFSTNGGATWSNWTVQNWTGLPSTMDLYCDLIDGIPKDQYQP